MRPIDRERLLLRLADLLEANAQELAELEAIDNGKPVTMARPGLRQSGVGFEADLKSRQYSLLSQVKTRYEPNAARQAR